MRGAVFGLLLLAACGSDECPKGSSEGLGGVCQWAGGSAAGSKPAQVYGPATAGRNAWQGGVFDEAGKAGSGNAGSVAGTSGSGGRHTDSEGTDAGSFGGGTIRSGSGGSSAGAGGSLGGQGSAGRSETVEPHDPTERPDAGAVVARCGDGVVDPGETCDGTCFNIDCDDGNLCTEEHIAGSPDSCDVVCVRSTLADGTRCGYEVQMTECRAGQCLSKCGNGKIDPNEVCDGNCPTTCDDSNPCTADVLVGSAATCSAGCVHKAVSAGTSCTGGVCDETGQCVP